MKQIEIKSSIINIIGIEDNDYISLTYLVRIKNPKEQKDDIKNV